MKAIRLALDVNGYIDTSIMAYSANILQLTVKKTQEFAKTFQM